MTFFDDSIIIGNNVLSLGFLRLEQMGFIMNKLFTFFILFISLFASGPVLGMKRKRSPEDDDKSRPLKKRKIIRDEFSSSSSCSSDSSSDEESEKENRHVFPLDLEAIERNKTRKKRYKNSKRGKFAACKQADDLYYCPDCYYSSADIRLFEAHLRDIGHGGMSKRRREPKKGMYLEYKGSDGKFYCPKKDCGVCSKKYNSIKTHIGEHKRKATSQASLVEEFFYFAPLGYDPLFDQNTATLQYFTYLTHPLKNGHGAFASLFNFSCIFAGKRESRMDSQEFAKQSNDWEKYARQEKFNVCDFNSSQLIQIIRKFDFFQAVKDKTDNLTKDCLFIDGYCDIDKALQMPEGRRNVRAFRAESKAQVVFVKISRDHWVLVLISNRGGKDIICVVDSAQDCGNWEYSHRLAQMVRQVYRLFKSDLDSTEKEK